MIHFLTNQMQIKLNSKKNEFRFDKFLVNSGPKTGDNGMPEDLNFPKIPAKVCVNGRLWAQFGRLFF